MNIRFEIAKRPILFPLLVLIAVILVADAFLPTIFIRNHYSKHPEASCYKYLILDEGKITKKGNHVSYDARIVNWYDTKLRVWKNCTGDIKIYLPRFNEDSLEYPLLDYGDIISSSDTLIQLTNFSEEFNYVRMMRHKRIYHSAFINSWRVVDTNQGNPIIRISKHINKELKDRLFYSGLDKENRGLAVAMLLGDKKELNPDIRQAFNTSGLAHILCVSGLHIGIIVLAFYSLLGMFFYGTYQREKILIWLCILLVWCLDFIVGLTPSATRVAVMFTWLQISKLYIGFYDSKNSLLLLAFCSLVYNPLLLFNISFQLSYLAVLGILIFVYPLKNLVFGKNIQNSKFLNSLANILCASTSAQIFTFPIVLITFGYFPIFFLLSNLIVLPFLQIILSSLVVLLVVVDIPLLGDLIAWVCNLEMDFLVFVAKYTDYLSSLI